MRWAKRWVSRPSCSGTSTSTDSDKTRHPNTRPSSRRFVTAVLDGRRPMINGSGDISRDFVYIDDVVEANMLASQAAVPANLTCNIATGSPTSLDQLLRAVALGAGRDVDPTFGPPRPGDIPHSYADIAVARRVLGYEPRTSLAEGIARTIDWYRLASMGQTFTARTAIP